MRLLILWPDYAAACAIGHEMELDGWDVEILRDGREILAADEGFDLLLLHLCLPGMDGLNAGDLLAAQKPICPPRILFAAPPEWCVYRPPWADCTVDTGVDAGGLCALLRILALKPLAAMAASQHETLDELIENLLDDLSFKKKTKGRACAAWLLHRMVPSPWLESEPLNRLYADCAQHFASSPAAVERSLRAAVETVFTQGDLSSIDRVFGATVDPERGKPTNRAFLIQAAQQLRYSLATARSLNSNEMHHSPAAPTSV